MSDFDSFISYLLIAITIISLITWRWLKTKSVGILILPIGVIVLFGGLGLALEYDESNSSTVKNYETSEK